MANVIGTGIQRAAVASRVVVQSTNLTFASWRATVESNDLSTVNFESFVSNALPNSDPTGMAFDEGIQGILKSSVSFGGDWDAGTNPLDDPPGLYPRDDLPNVQLILNRSDATEYDFPYMRIRTVEIGADVTDKVTFSVGSAFNQGEFTWPSGSV